REAEVVDALLRADRRDDLALGVDLDAEAAVVEAREGLAELGAAAGRGVLVRAGVRDGPLHRLDDMRVGRLVRIADAERDHVNSLGLLVGDPPLELGEHVRRHRLEALRWISGSHAGEESNNRAPRQPAARATG